MIAERGNIDGHDVQAVVEVFAEGALFQRGAQVAIGGGNQAHVHFQGFRSAQAFEFALLQDAEQLHLNGRGDVADFVEEKRALVGKLEFTGLGSCGAGKRALFIAKKFAFEQGFGNGRAIDLDEGPGRAMGMLMNRARDQIFSHPALAAKQHRRVGGRHALDKRQHRLHRFALGHDVVVLIALAQGLAQLAVFLA